MSQPIKSLNDDKLLDFEEIYNLIISFDPSIDRYSQLISSRKNRDLYLHYSTNVTKLNDWKSDEMIWFNGSQKPVNQKAHL